MGDKAWIGVDFDGTLAMYDGWVGPDHCGEPIAPMVERVKAWLEQGRQVRIFTARIFPFATCVEPDDYARPYGVDLTERQLEAVTAIEAIRDWCRTHIGRALPITCVKDYGMIELYDDRAVQVVANTGELVGKSTRGL